MSKLQTTSHVSWWQRTETPRWLVLMVIVLTSLVPILGNYVVAKRHHQPALWTTQAASLVDSMNAFQGFSSDFTNGVLTKGKVNSFAQQRVIVNLNEQFSFMRLVELQLPQAAHGDIHAFQKAIVELVRATWKVEDAATMTDYWKASEEWDAARTALVAHLRP